MPAALLAATPAAEPAAEDEAEEAAGSADPAALAADPISTSSLGAPAVPGTDGAAAEDDDDEEEEEEEAEEAKLDAPRAPLRDTFLYA
jgi:hypothetical protein